MSRKPRETPAMIAAKLMTKRKQDFEAVGLSPGMAEMDRNRDVETTRAGEKRGEQKVEADSARRLDMIDEVRSTLRAQGCGGCYDAMRRLELDFLVRRGEGDKGRTMERVDGQFAKDLADKIIEAGDRVDGVRARLSRRDWQMVSELIRPTQAYEGWRAVVRFVAGEDDKTAQAASVRAAAVNLRDAYAELEEARAGKRRAA